MDKKKYADKLVRFGAAVKRMREEKKLSQQMLANECDVDLRTIQRIEKGEHGITLHLVFALSDALSINICVLIGDI